MRVVHLSTHDTKGGAAGSAHRLHKGLLEEGIDSRMYVRDQHNEDPTITEHEPESGWMNWIRLRLYREKIKYDFRQYRDTRPEGVEIFTDDRASYQLTEIKAFDPDILNLHWVADFIDYRHFFGECVEDTPIIWRLSDLNPFSGGCHYDQGCGKYRMACGACPQLGSAETNDLSRAIWNRKEEAFGYLEDDQLHFVAQSEWIRDQVQASPLTGRFAVTVIPNGLNTELFRPRNTQGLRAALEIPSGHQIILFVAQSIQNHRKGFDLLADAMSSLSQNSVTLLSIGGQSPELKTSMPHVHLGRVESDLLLSIFYSLADLFIIPSRQDNLPNTVLESMACGTPVVGFDTGGIPDMVRPNETGWLAKVGDVKSLRKTIEQALSEGARRRQLGNRARKVVEEEYTLENQAQSYKSLYESMLSGQEEYTT